MHQNSNVAELPRSCPLWVTEYAVWHANNRASPDARHLVLHCRNIEHGGLGDHIRGMLWALRVAAAHRVLLFVGWGGRFSLDGLLDPNAIDWRPPHADAAEKMRRRQGAQYIDQPFYSAGWHESVISRMGAALALQNNSDIELCASMEYDWNTSGLDSSLPVPSMSAADLPGMWSLLFQPSEYLKEQVDAVLGNLLGAAWPDRAQPPPPFVAAHLRLGGLDGEKEPFRERTWACDDVLQAALSCSAQLQQKLSSIVNATPSAEGPLPAPLVMITDNTNLRSSLANGALGPGVVGPPGLAHHIKKGKDAAESRNSSFVELALLARAACLVTTEGSGFGLMALWYDPYDPQAIP